VLGGVTIFRDASEGGQELLASYPPYPQDEFLFQVTQGLPLFNGWFFRKEVFDRFGFFDTRYRYAADRDFLIRLAMGELPYVCIDQLVYHYRQHSGSLTFNEENTAESGPTSEFRTIAEDYLSRKEIPTTQRKVFLGWHSQITSNQTLYALSQANLRKALYYGQRGWAHNSQWPAVFVRSVFTSIKRLLRSFGR
jgi:hypothetical protein